MSVDADDLRPVVTIRALEPDVRANEPNMRLALASLSRDDALFCCARINALVTGFGADASNFDRQRQAIGRLCSPAQIRRLERFAARYGGTERVIVFFRGQLLELARWLVLFGENQPNDGNTFADAKVRAKFARAAFIASELWEEKLFGVGGIKPSLDPYEQLRKALGPFRKNIEEANLAPHPGFVIYRGWKLYSHYLPLELPGFTAAFESATGLSAQQYLISAFAILQRTFFDFPDHQRLFKSDYVEGDSPFRATFRKFMELQSQTPEEWAERLNQSPSEATDVSLRKHPVLSFNGGLSIILDPTCFIDNLTSAPLFLSIKGGLNHNRVFGAFGDAVERYVIDLFKRRPDINDEGLSEHIEHSIAGLNAAGQQFEIDALVSAPPATAVFEVKAVWIRDDTVLHADPEVFIGEIRKKYGYAPDTNGRGKGIFQLARSVGALTRREWSGPNSRLIDTREIFPVLLVYDGRMASPGTGHFLEREFRQLLGSTPEGVLVHPVIIMTVADLEYIVSTLPTTGLLALLRSYSAIDPDRISSFHNFVLRLRPRNPPAENPMLAELNDELFAATKSALFGNPSGQSATSTPTDSTTGQPP